MAAASLRATASSGQHEQNAAPMNIASTLPSAGTMTPIIVAVTMAVIVVGGISIAVGRVRKNRRRVQTIASGIRSTGLVTAVKGRTGFDRERGRINVVVRLTYLDPRSKLSVVTEHSMAPTTKNLPPHISGPGAGITDVRAVREQHRESMAWREQLAQEGKSKAEIRAAVVARALEQAEDAPGDVDAQGFLTIKEPVPVTVYLPREPSAGHALVVEFAPR
jgi:hypothetical protein